MAFSQLNRIKMARVKFTMMIGPSKKRTQVIKPKPQTSLDRRLIELEMRINSFAKEVMDYKKKYSPCIIMKTSDNRCPIRLNLEFMRRIEDLAVQFLVQGNSPIVVFTS
ncbi:uncharacterized protein LOC108088275 [Drosophila ficusphila]|uniref:uncharacterized protein LOC108088275 n=1 Tax=Drosophila ficusphila TaxID=30025 RepID=UPI0007E707FB|nr:uncharacterized protein LOC108088275 [Drosophila ficusphila]